MDMNSLQNMAGQKAIYDELKKIQNQLQTLISNSEKGESLEPIKKDNPFEFEIGEQYWYLEADNGIDTEGREWSGELWEIKLLIAGSVFKSLELAEREGLKRQLIQKIEQWKWENDENYGVDPSYFGIVTQKKGEDSLSVDTCRYRQINEINFNNRYMADAALEHFGDRLKILFLPKYSI